MIGELCREWVHLESITENLFLAVAQWDYRLPMTYPMASCLAFRDQIAAIKICILCRNPPAEIVQLTHESMDYIANELRSAENRYVHDIMGPSDDGVRALRITMAHRIARESGSGEMYVEGATLMIVALAELQELIADIRDKHVMIASLDIWVWTKTTWPTPSMSRLKRPLQRHLLRLQEKQRQKDKPVEARTRRQKPSAASRRRTAMKDSVV